MTIIQDIKGTEFRINVKRSSTQDANSFDDQQEPTINIESEIDNKKSDDEMHQVIESVETENFVDDFIAGSAAAGVAASDG
jgi:hypothetical protein